ncbi:MAG TPA: cation diffusion facilitator family transporter [Magnetospirillum sp.]|jgi:cobalt-zinc-cadmium efflux system protein|nr:cation diffusion facilitator family transporter [Magnetospirillum sp.]
MAHDSHHHHHHSHDQDHHHHHHGNERRVFWALLLTAGFMVVEVVGGVVSGSLALLADAGHMLTDAAALGLSLAAFRASRRPETLTHSYGQHRFQVLAAFLNGAALVGIAVWIAIEAVQRLFAPVPVLGGTMMVVAALGLAVNVVAFAILHGGDRDNLNMRGAALHVLGDMLASVGAIVAALVILWTGWTPIDPILSVLVSLLVLRSAWMLLSRSWHVLMEGAPVGVDVEELSAELVRRVPGVEGIHHVHVWMLTPEHPIITLHATIGAEADHDEALHALQAILSGHFDLGHATIQVERSHCPNPADHH